MNCKTFEAYKCAVKAKYELEKEGIYAGFLYNPTPSQIKKLCILFNDNLGKTDVEIFRNFFGFSAQDDITRKIQRFDTSKFKPICTFLKGETELSQHISVDLIAILIDYNPRPLAKYLGSSTTGTNIEYQDKEDKEDKKEKFAANKTDFLSVDEINIKSRISKKVLIVISFLLIIVLIIIQSSSKPNCMIWKEHHYVSVSCDKIAEENHQKIVPYNEDLQKKFRKIKPTAQTKFFNDDGTPRIWYGRSYDYKYEYFTHYGLHPETNKTLKPITKHMIKKYILKEN